MTHPHGVDEAAADAAGKPAAKDYGLSRQHLEEPDVGSTQGGAGEVLR
jgi:hypothetical protein